MDKEHAKFILQSYRPDGADANDADFREALQFAAEDRELGLWLSEERAHDAIFAEALGTVDIPSGLRDEILTVMDYESNGKEMASDIDAAFIGAMADVSPPEGLREQILSAMEIESNGVKEVPSAASEKITKFPMRWLNMAAVAAVLVLGATFIFSGVFEVGNSDQLKLSEVHYESGMILNASHEVDISNNTLEEVNTWFEGEGMPVGNSVPEGLVACDVVGGRKVSFDNGVQASMIFFEKKDAGEFYLMVLEVDSLKDANRLVQLNEVKLQKCSNCPMTHFNVTAWKDETKAYLLLSKSEEKMMVELF